MRRILILNGAPRRNGNTASLIRAFSAGAVTTGHDVHQYNIQDLNIHPCIGCLKGGRDLEHPCVQMDDMDILYREVRESDTICFATPVYNYAVSTQLKCVLDRFCALLECNMENINLKKDFILLAVGGFHRFEELEFWYDGYLKHFGGTNRGKIFCGGVNNMGDINGNEKLLKAYNLGRFL